LLQYLDILYPNGEPIKTITNIAQNSRPKYKEEVTQFFDIVSTYMQYCRYDEWPTYKMTFDPEKIAKASWA
jgi:hypothetical protein